MANSNDEHVFSPRLSRIIKPASYSLFFEPDLERFVFTGDATIFININEATDKIVLHSLELDITFAELFINGESLDLSPELKPETETLILKIGKFCGPCAAKLRIKFSGVIGERMFGFYRSSYTLSGSGERKFMAATQFEATDARRCFPCWDEPDIPATFDVTLAIPKDKTAISNMPAAEMKESGSKKIIRFARTPVMSTYLLAFFVGDFEFVERSAESGVLVRVVTTPGKREQGRFALDTAVKILDFYDSYFGIPYPLPKLDLIAVPDFSAGAMENWGAIAYREAALLIDPEHAAASSYQRVAVVIAHEIAHQWFGNLVTMDWWTHLWLNEGFATFIEYLAVNHVFPEWEIWTQFMHESFAPALRDDGLRSTHPVEVEVRNASEIGEIFDEISYSKGASVLRMIEVYLTPEVFRRGLQEFLRRHAYANASTDDLWAALEKVSGKQVKSIMDSWIKQPGYPVLSLENSGDSMMVRQERFMESPEALASFEKAQVWQIPVPLGIAGSAGEEHESALINGREIQLDFPARHRWMKLNAHQVAFVRVNYTPELWLELSEAVVRNELGVIDRFGLLDDALALSKSGRLATTYLLSLVAASKNEDHFICWVAIVRALHSLSLLLNGSPANQPFEEFGRNNILRPICEKLGWVPQKGETHTVAILRGMVLRAAGELGDADVIAKAKELFQTQIAGQGAIIPDLRGAAYGAIAIGGGDEEYEDLLNVYNQTDLQEEKVRCLRAMGQFRNMEVISRALAFGMTKEVRAQDTHYLIASVGVNPSAGDAAWKFMRENWNEFDRRYGEGGMKMLSRFIQPATERFASEERAQEVEEFFRQHLAPSASRAIAQSLERTRTNAAWFKRDYEHIKNWLESRVN
jgi:puromycin-sensitive aminopeptidase